MWDVVLLFLVSFQFFSYVLCTQVSDRGPLGLFLEGRHLNCHVWVVLSPEGARQIYSYLYFMCHANRLWGCLLLLTPGHVLRSDFRVILRRKQSFLNLSCFRTFGFRTPSLFLFYFAITIFLLLQNTLSLCSGHFGWYGSCCSNPLSLQTPLEVYRVGFWAMCGHYLRWCSWQVIQPI